MKVLVLTGMYPTAEDPSYGLFVAQQVESLRRADPALDCEVLFFNGRVSRLNYLSAAIDLGRRLRKGRHDLVHAHYGLAGVVAATQIRVPTVLTLHGSDVHVGWQRALSRFGVRRAQAVITVSAGLKRLVEQATGATAHVIPCGIDLESFRPAPMAEARQRLGWSPHGKRVLFPSDPNRLVKGFDIFSEVLRRIQPAGGEVEPAVLKDVPPARVPDVMNACDLMVVTSRSEGSPMAVKEAMACNLPIVSLEVGDVAELLERTRNCVVVPRGAGAIESLAAAARQVLSMGGRSDGRTRMAGLSHEAIARRILDVYERAVVTPNRSSGPLPAGSSGRGAPAPPRPS